MDIAAAKAAFKAGRNAIEMELGEVRAERDAALEALEEAQRDNRVLEAQMRVAGVAIVGASMWQQRAMKAQGKLEAIQEVTEDAGCNLPSVPGEPCGECGNCRTKAILRGSKEE